MDAYDSSSDEYTLASKNLDNLIQRKNLLQQKYDSITHHDWQSYYTSQLTLINMTLETIESDHSVSSDTYDIMKLQQNYFQYMLDHHLGYDDFFHSTQGISYMLQIMNDYLPFFMEILIIFIASMIYCSSFQNNLNIHQLIPISCFSKQTIKLLTTTLIGISIVVFIEFIAYLCGVIGNSSGHFNSPIFIYSLQGVKRYVSFASMALQTLCLGFLSIVCIINIVSIISQLTKRNITCLMISFIIMMSMTWAITQIVPLFPIAYILPTTYFNFLKVVSGNMLYITGNEYVNFDTGVIVLIVSNFLLFVFSYLLCQYQSNKGVRIL